jgi:hypothetical protein
VCVLDAGKWLDRVLQARDRGRGLELEDLTKRLAIDQLRVALSRPSERLYWLDVNPSDRVLAAAERMLGFQGRAYPMVPAVLLKTLEEETLDAEERVLLCQNDARQFMEVRPALAWSRARQAVSLLGVEGSSFAVADPAARRSAHMTLCQVAFTLAIRKVSLPAEMGRVDLFREAASSAAAAGKPGLESVIYAIGDCERFYLSDKATAVARVASSLNLNQADIEPWLMLELQPRSAAWFLALEEQVERLPALMLSLLPPLYSLFAPQEAVERTAHLRERVLRELMRQGAFQDALGVLALLPDADPKLTAECLEGLGELETAAAHFLKAGSARDALRCYRAIPNLEKSLALLEEIGKHPARESLEWLRRMRDLAAERPAEFSKVLLPAEKKLLEQVLEAGLGVSRKKAAAPKAPVRRKAPVARKMPKPRKDSELF